MRGFAVCVKSAESFLLLPHYVNLIYWEFFTCVCDCEHRLFEGRLPGGCDIDSPTRCKKKIIYQH
jgi:hypothetical protein